MVDLLTLASKVPSLVSMVQLTEVDTIVTTANVDVEGLDHALDWGRI